MSEKGSTNKIKRIHDAGPILVELQLSKDLDM